MHDHDNHFCPTPADHGSLFTLIAGANLIALATGLLALARYAGWL